MSYQAYAGIQQKSESPRDLEIRAISFVTQKLIAANQAGAEPLDRIRALNGNIKLWALLINDLSNPDNALPAPLKTAYIRLGTFAKRASTEALTARADLSTLIQLNTDVLEALTYQGRTQAAA